MIPFDKKAIDICKEHKCVFFEHKNRVVYGEYLDKSYITKSLPGLTIEDKEELNLITSIIGKECYRIINAHYIEFFDPEVIEYIKVSAPLCVNSNGHFTYNNQKYTGNVPSPKMLEAAECIYPVIKMCISQKLTEHRENKLYCEFSKNTLDGMSAIIYTYLSKEKISKDFIVLLKKKQNNCNVFFLIKKTAVFIFPKRKEIEFIVSEKHYDFVSNKTILMSKQLRMDVFVSKSKKVK